MKKQILKQKDALTIANELLEVLNHGALAIMISIGHRTQLFDTMANLPPAKYSTIAQEAGLNERYVKEWLGALVTGGIIEYNPEADTYYLPPEYGEFLTRQATPNNIAAVMQYIPLLAQVEDNIIPCFYQGGGLPYSAYPRFNEVMAEDSGQTVVAVLEEAIIPLVNGLQEKLTQGIKVLDLGCGSGQALIKMAKLFPNSQFLGIDFTSDAIEKALNYSQTLGLTNIDFQVQDAAQLSLTTKFDLITTFDAIHDQAKPAQVLKNIYDSLDRDGVYLMQDIKASKYLHKNLDHPANIFLYTVSCLHCTSVSLAYNGDGLGTMWGEETALEMLQQAGFSEITVKQLPHDPMNNFYISRK
ncbi:class I SAM-dependent methyltransferase [Geminocystis sp. CENA526]|uniref:class I SAM-dependent methyltransferase n=1 Tax=Geminocystis sp. CENA526 TaxID=1355871 RepID=UPI003D6E71D0